ncbi:MAG TPA: RNA-binding protein [Nitrososphaerales archaeon]|nr:RNA-binding protein [Nitrososphaerales archaeon]
MIYSGIESSLSEAGKLFETTVSRREQLIKESREVISISAKSIVCIHNSNFDEAKKLQKQAIRKLEDLREIAGSDMVRYIFPSEQELVECSVVLALSIGADIPSRKHLKVENSSYILGLLDSIGELKRMVYDTIRVADFEKAEKLFSIMQQLYLLLSPFSIYDHVAQGVKRKLDVARILIEDTRGTVTEEARRRELINAVDRLSLQLDQQSKAN